MGQPIDILRSIILKTSPKGRACLRCTCRVMNKTAKHIALDMRVAKYALHWLEMTRFSRQVRIAIRSYTLADPVDDEVLVTRSRDMLCDSWTTTTEWQDPGTESELHYEVDALFKTLQFFVATDLDLKFPGLWGVICSAVPGPKYERETASPEHPDSYEITEVYEDGNSDWYSNKNSRFRYTRHVINRYYPPLSECARSSLVSYIPITYGNETVGRMWPGGLERVCIDNYWEDDSGGTYQQIYGPRRNLLDDRRKSILSVAHVLRQVWWFFSQVSQSQDELSD